MKNPVKWHEITYLCFENFVGQAYTLHVYKTDDYDWCSDTDRPSRNFNGVTVHPADIITNKENLNRYASDCPFTVDFTFADGLALNGVRYCQKEATKEGYESTEKVLGRDGKVVYEITARSDKKSSTLRITVHNPLDPKVTLPFKAGKYGVVSDKIRMLEHSFLVSYKDRECSMAATQYDCFGGSRITIKGKDFITDGNCYEAFARNICTFDPINKEGELNKWFGTREFPVTGDSGGMLYGWHGVCHTLANRLLLATDKIGMIVNSHIGGGRLSLLVYGPYGKTNFPPLILYLIDPKMSIPFPYYYSLCDYITRTYQEGKTADVAAYWGTDQCEAGKDACISLLQYHASHSTDRIFSELIPVEIENWNSAEAIDDRIAQKRLKIIARILLGSEYDDNQINPLAESLGDFMTVKMGWDTKFSAQLQTAYAKPDDSFLGGFVDDINQRFMVFLKKGRELLGDTRFKKLFDIDWVDDFQLLDKSMLVQEQSPNEN